MHLLGTRWRPAALLSLLAALAVGCPRSEPVAPSEEPKPPPWFLEVGQERGLHFVHDPGPLPADRYFMPQAVGSGAALFDFDGDGRLDVYLIQNGGPKGATNRLFCQEADGRFTDVSAGSSLDVAGYGMGVAVGDVNNDGRPDVLLTRYGGVSLFLNNGGGAFTDVTAEAGLQNLLWGMSAAFFDYDRDGWLDLVLVNYVDFDPSVPCLNPAGQRDYCTPKAFAGTVTKLYRNLGKAGKVRFEDVTVKAGLARHPGPGLGVFCADFDGDRWPDILVANDGRPNHLWINQKNGTFKEEAVLRGLACNAMGKAEANMGIAVGDVDGDGMLDVFVTHLATETNTLWRQGPRGQFRDRTVAGGLAAPRWRGTGFGAVLSDFDHDGTLDLAIANGGVSRHDLAAGTGLAPFWAAYADRNQLFAGEGDGRFRDISEENAPFCGTAAVSRGLACGDFDNDGAVDLLVTAVGGPARLYRNVAPKRGHWLTVRAVDPSLGGRDAYGAEVTVRARGGRWTRWVNPGSSYLCSNDPRAHFGLGGAERVEGITVVWPDGTEEQFAGTAADQPVTLRKGEGRPTGERQRGQEP
jgi:hypothetical protein